MNERIRELRRVAEELYIGFPDSIYNDKVNEKFAELIVRECAGVAWGIYANQEIANGIKQHFGVE